MSAIRRNSLLSILITSTMVMVFEPSISVAAGPAITTTTQTVNTILSGKTSPTTAIGKNGDFHIDTKSMLFYGPKKNGIWPLGISLKGEDGKNGNDGKNGLDGTSNTKTVVGEKGPKGDTGAQGPQGLQGPKGDTGATGLTGATGPAGAKGDTGAKGETGAAGLVGAKGDTGATGPAGPQGLQGLQGLQGEAGPKGDPGTPGTNGVNGAAGAKGDTGAQGPQGIQGPVGPSLVYNKSVTFLYAMNGKSNDSNLIANLPGDQSFSFQILITGLTTRSVYLGMELIAAGATTNYDYVISSSAKYDATQLPGTGYVFTMIGTITTGASGSSVYVRITEQTGNLSTAPMTLNGKAVFTRTESVN